MADELIGGVAVSISGDTSQLKEAFAAAQTTAAVAGGQVASAFNSGARGANQFDTAIQALTTALAEQNAVLSLSIQRNMAHASSLRTATEAAHAGVSEIQATSGALRVLEGNSALRAAERFLTTIPGLGAALQFAFPVVGAIALLEGLSRLLGKSEELKAAEKELADATKAADDAFSHLQSTLDHLNVEHVTAIFGSAAGKGAETTVLEQQAQRIRIHMDDLRDSINEVAYAEASSLKNYIPFHSSTASVDKIKAVGAELKTLGIELQEVEGKIGHAQEQTGIAVAEEAGQVRAARIANEEKANSQLGQMARAVAESKIFTVRNAAAEEVRVAQEKEAAITAILERELPKRLDLIRQRGAAESQGKSAPEQQRIGVQTSGQVAEAEAEAAREAYTAHQAVVVAQRKQTQDAANEARDAWERAYDAITKAAKETSDAQERATEKAINAAARVQEIQDKSTGQQNELVVLGDKIRLEGTYGQQINHTLAQQLTYMQQLADLDARARQAKIDGLTADLAVAEAASDELRDVTRIATLRAEIAAATLQSLNASASAQNKIEETARQKSLNGQLQQGFGHIPSGVGQAAAGGVVDGKGIGQAIKQSLTGIGKQMLGDVFEKLIAQLLISTGIQTVFNAIFPVATTAQVIATTANTVALSVLTDVMMLQSALFGFADGGSPPVGVPSIVGERGPEIFVPHQSGVIIPNHAIAHYAGGAGDWRSQVSSSSSMGDLNMHFHGISHGSQIVDHVMRELPRAIKRRTSSAAQYSR